MSIHHLERAGELTMRPAARKLVFMALCDDADKTTGIAMPGLEKVMKWAGCGKSQVAEHITALIADGYVERVAVGRIGRRAEYRVFAVVACCAEHARAVEDRADSVGGGSGSPDPVGGRASGEGPESIRRASGPDRMPPQPPNSPTEGEGYVPDSPRARETTPTPKDELGGMPSTVSLPLAFPDRCPDHQSRDYAPPCGACKVARMTHEASLRDAVRQEHERQRIARRDEARLQQLDIDQCRLCDDHGKDSTGLPCTHDPDLPERARRGAELARQALRRGGAS